MRGFLSEASGSISISRSQAKRSSMYEAVNMELMLYL